MECGLIKSINLSNNNIGDDGVKHIIALLRMKETLTILYLNNNQIGDQGVKLLADTLSHHTSKLKNLYLNENPRITNQCVDHLVKMFKLNQSLKILWLLKCGINGNGKQKLIQAAEEKQNFYLNIERYD